ncbi:MAG TPA: hypothetical protein VF824_22875 [Thermoanaerobaculia bacterium]|jgi:hypothetical protein
MQQRTAGLLLAVVLAAVAQGCATAAKPRNACEVLTAEDVRAVQGEAFVDAKLSDVGGLSQCFYELPSFANSVSVDLVPTGGHEFWRTHFPDVRDGEREEEEEHHATAAGKREENEEEEKLPPRPIRGIGNEAVWAGSRIAGSLYVRKGDAVVRVSVGGAGTEEEKIEKSKRLASKALAKF